MELNIHVVTNVKLLHCCSSGLLTHNNDSFVLVSKIKDWLKQLPDTYNSDLF